MSVSFLARCGVGLAVFFAAGSAAAQTPDATLTVRLSVASTSVGSFNNGGLLATRVGVFARSGFQARLSSATGIQGPTSGTRGAGSTFDVIVDRLYSPTAAGAANPYTIELTWNDTAVRSFASPTITLAPGTTNMAGPFTVDNAAPPAATAISCYPNPPSTSTDLYVYWSVPTARPVDFDRYELHRGTTAGFTPSAATLVASLPYGTSNRVDTGRTPDTAYYYCFRVVDQYGATSDRCTTTPCRTAAATPDAGPDVMDVGVDTATDVAVDRADVTDAADAAMDVSDATADRADAITDTAADRADAAVDRTDVAIDLGGMAGFTSTPPSMAPANTPYTYNPDAAGAMGEAPTGFSAMGLPPGATIDPRTGAISWTPGYDEVGMMRMFTVVATLPGGTQVRQTVTVTVTCPDNDRDGHADARCPMGVGDDCDDARVDTYPGAPERCNGIDDDCDGLIDEGDPASLCTPGQSCDSATHTCRPTCMTSADCTAAPRVCTGDRVCALCMPGPSGDASACARSEDGRLCVADSVGGVFCGCMSDADCGDANSGRTCDLDRHRCIPGCGTAAGRNGCPTGQQCVVSGAGATARGVCTTDCTSSVVCGVMVPALPFCPDVGATRRCVECRGDADCSGNTDGRKYCNRTTSRCVSCLDGGSSQCTAAGPGAACLPGGTCGCNTDTDCGGRDSGRICDGYTHACRAGCRPAGAMGNACPAGMVCTAVFSGLGRCGEAPDSGVDAGDGASDVTDAASDRTVPNDLAVQDVPIAVDVTPDVPVLDVPDDLGMDAGLRVGNFQGGCGCRVGNAPSRKRVLAWGLLALVMLRRRRR